MTNTVTRVAPVVIGILNNMLRAMELPRISATEVETEASTAKESIALDTTGFIYIVAASERQRPVAIPRCATLCCRTISIIVDNVTIHNREYPYPEPVAIFAAQFPGSMNPTVTSRPGPIYLKISRAPNAGIWSFLLRSLKNPKELNKYLIFNILDIFRSHIEVPAVMIYAITNIINENEKYYRLHFVVNIL
jgi:hypothetical protein